MAMATSDEVKLLCDAQARAKALIASLEAQQQDLLHFAGRLASDTIKPGHEALARAIESARHTLVEIEQALRQTGADIESEEHPDG